MNEKKEEVDKGSMNIPGYFLVRRGTTKCGVGYRLTEMASLQL